MGVVELRSTLIVNLSRAAVTAAAVLAVTACTETRFEEATGDGQIRGVAGIANADDAIFLIEERELTQLAFKSVSAPQEFDDLSYNFNFDLPIPLDVDRRLATRFVDVVDSMEYTLALGGTVATPELFVWERPEPVWAGTESEFDVGGGHLSTQLGSVDVYFAAPGTAPVAGNALGTLGFGEQFADVRFATGEYAVTLTPAGDPATILFRSGSLTVSGGNTFTIAIFDADPSIPAPVSVRLIDTAGAAAELADERFPPTAQFIHAAFGAGNVDVASGGNFAAPLATNLAFGQVSADVNVTAGTETYAFAPTGNTMPLVEADLGVAVGSRAMVVLLGAVGDLQVLNVVSPRRGLATVAQFRVTHASNNADAIDVYFTETGMGADGQLPSIIGQPFGQASNVGRVVPGTFDLIITATGSTDPIVGPTPVTLDTDDLLEIVVLDTADPNVIDAIIFSNINP